jgi:hypothetical protein
MRPRIGKSKGDSPRREQKRTASKRRKIVLPVSTARDGTLPGVDVNDSAALLAIMERR